MAVGDFSSTMPSGTVPVQPGPVIRKVFGPVPVVRDPGTSNTLVQPSSSGSMKYRPFMSGWSSTQGSAPTSMKAVVYSVSAFGAVTSRKLASGYWRSLISVPIGARVPSGAATFETTRRVISMVTSGYPKT